jgi:hypothetical protein
MQRGRFESRSRCCHGALPLKGGRFPLRLCAADLVDTVLQLQAVERLDAQAGEDPDAVLQHPERLAEGLNKPWGSSLVITHHFLNFYV